MSGIVYHYPIYGDRPFIGRSNLLYACTYRSLSLLRETLASLGGSAYNRPEKEPGFMHR